VFLHETSQLNSNPKNTKNYQVDMAKIGTPAISSGRVRAAITPVIPHPLQLQLFTSLLSSSWDWELRRTQIHRSDDFDTSPRSSYFLRLSHRLDTFELLPFMRLGEGEDDGDLFGSTG